MRRIPAALLAACLAAGLGLAAAGPVLAAGGKQSKTAVQASDTLRINPRLDYNSDSDDGGLFVFPKGWDKQDDGRLAAGRPNLVMFYQDT